MEYPFVSVVVPVLNDSVHLKKCLQALERQAYPKEFYEIIVVDNGSQEDIESVTSIFEHVILTHEEYPTLHAARNKGIFIAKGEVFAFTDADCLPDKDWLKKGIEKLLSTPHCGLVGGRVDIFFKDPKRPTGAELFEKITAFKQKEYIEKMHFAAPANAFTLKSVIKEVGYFRKTLKSGADVEWGNRTYWKKYKLVYADEACVLHPARRTIKEVCKKHARVVGGLYDIRIYNKPLTTKGWFTFLKDDWPHLSDFKNIFLDERLSSYIEKAKVFFVMLLVKFTRTFEKTMLFFGKKSRRR